MSWLRPKNPISIPNTFSDVTGVLDVGSHFEGELVFEGSLRIGGVFKGKITTPDTLVISEGARVEGYIEAGIVIISGEVRAEVKATNRIEVYAPAIFRGTMITPSLKVEEGVIIEGSSKMSHPS